MMSVFSIGSIHAEISWTLSDDGTLTISGTGDIKNNAWEYRSDIKNVVIEYGVTSIGDRAFSSCTSLTSVTIPESVTSIGKEAFAHCWLLPSIVIPNSVTSIEYETFWKCHSLTSITIPNSVTNIEYGAFMECTSLTSITIPNSVTSIGDFAFEKCSSLTSVTIPESVTSLGCGAFQYCTSLTSVTIPESLTAIGGIFFDCYNLASITIPKFVTDIGESTFCRCHSLTSVTCEATTPPSCGSSTFYEVDKSIPVYVPANSVEAYKSAAGWWEFTNILAIGAAENTNTWTLSDDGTLTISGTEMPNYASGDAPWYSRREEIKKIVIKTGITNIGECAFYDCNNFTSITIPNSVTSIGNQAFYNCRNITSITLPNTLKTIGDEAFYNCSKLENISIPASVTSIGNRAFFYADAIQELRIEDGSTILTFGNVGSGIYCQSIYLGRNITYTSDEGIIYPPVKNVTVGPKVTILSNKIFRNGYNVKSFDLSNATGVTSIGENAFDGCSNEALTSIDLTKTKVTSIGKYAFAGCRANVTLPSTLTTIDNQAFANSCFTSITIPNSVTSIGNQAFCNCRNITSITLPNTLKTIGDEAFYNCSKLENISIPASVTSIGNRAFFYADAIQELRIEDGSTILTFGNVGSGIYCQSIYLGRNITYTSDEGIIYPPVKNVTVGPKVTILSNKIFRNGYNVKSFDLSNATGVTSIGENAFDGCSNEALTSIDLTKTKVTSIGKYAFAGCRANVTLPSTLTTIDNQAFANSCLTSITIPNSVTSIGNQAFYNSSITNITLPNTLTTIGDEAFRGCTKLENISIPASVTTIGDRVTWDANAIQEFRIEDGTTTLTCGKISEGGSYGYTCQSFYLGRNVTYTDNQFIHTPVKKVTIGPNVTTIHENMFRDRGVEIFDLNNATSLTTIGDEAFKGCYNMTSITIPKSVVCIGEKAFSGCNGLTSVTCAAYTPPTCDANAFGDVNKSIPLYVPTNSVGAYKVADVWKDFTNMHATVIADETYIVTLDHNRGVGDPEQITVAYNQPMPEDIGLVAPTRTGYVFNGYSVNGIFYYDANLKSVRNFDKKQDCTLLASWKLRTTIVTLNPKCSNNDTLKVTATYGKAMPTGENIVAPTRAGYTFAGYYSSENGKGTQYYNADMTSKRTWNKDVESMTLYAYWKAITIPVTDIALSDATATLWVDEEKALTAIVTPTNASNKAVTWTSLNTAVATISANGLIKAIAKGTATITCKAKDGSGIYKKCTVTVKQPVTSIALSASEATLWVGKSQKLTATVNPTTASKTTVNWYSSDENVATISKYGYITARGRGTCVITCEAADGYGTKTVCDVTVKQQVTSVSFSYETLSVTCGTTKTLTPRIYPSNADIKTLTWKSTDKSVATVTSDGVLKAIALGTTKIICTATDGFKKADTITVEVVPLKITDSKPAIAEGTYGAGCISYTRTLTAGKYAAFCMPYDVNLNDYTEEFSKVFVPMDMTLLKSSGTLMVMFKNVSLTETIPAGQPFVALAAKSGAVAIVNDVKKTFTTLTTPEPTSLDVYNWNGSNGFLTFNPDISVKIGGTYGKLTGLDSEKYYTVSTSGTMSKASSVSPYRIYIYKDDNSSNAKVKEIVFSFDEDEMATGIEELRMTNDELPVEESPIYNLSGQRINKANAQNGIYIKNGKKYAK